MIPQTAVPTAVLEESDALGGRERRIFTANEPYPFPGWLRKKLLAGKVRFPSDEEACHLWACALVPKPRRPLAHEVAWIVNAALSACEGDAGRAHRALKRLARKGYTVPREVLEPRRRSYARRSRA